MSKGQGDFSQEKAELIAQERFKARAELLNELVRLQILNYSSYDEIYFATVNGYLVIITP
jgi:hypothetical protein